MSKIKRLRSVVLGLTAIALFTVVGCGKSKTVQEPKSSTQSLDASFSAADPAAKSLADKASKFIQAGDYGNAADFLKKLLQEKNLTPDQFQTASNLFHEVSKFPRLAP